MRCLCGFWAVVTLVAWAIIEAHVAIAANHVVGGSDGWDVTADLDTWANSQTFRVGDELVFKYTPGLHSVVEVAGEKEYTKCDMSSALNSMNDGASVVKLEKPGYRYFACGTVGHCDEGMKLKVKTLSANEPSSPSSPSSTFSSSASFTTHSPPYFCLGLCVFFSVVSWLNIILFV